MTPEILAKIMGIIAKTGDRVIVIDPKSGSPFALMGLEEYEKLISRPEAVLPNPPKAVATPKTADLTQNPGSGIIDPDLALFLEATQQAKGDWGGDEDKEEDRYYMEPTE